MFDIPSLLITVNVIGLSWSSLSSHSGSQTVVACYLISFRCFYEPDRTSRVLATDYSERLLSSASCPAIWSPSLLITVNVTAVWLSAMTLLITVNVWLVQRQASAQHYRMSFQNAVCLLHHHVRFLRYKPSDTELTLLITVNVQTHQPA